MGTAVRGGQALGVVPGDAQTVEAGVHLEVDGQPPAACVQRPGVFGAHHRLGQAVPGQQGGQLRPGIAKHQDRPPDAAPPQADTLGGGGHGKGVRARPDAQPGDLQVPVPVGVGLDYRHKAGPRRQKGAQGGQIVPQGGGVQLDPGPAPGGGGGADAGEGEGQKGGEQDHGQIVYKTVVHQQAGEAHHPGAAPDEDDAPGVEDIHRRRPAPEGGSGREGQALEPPQEEPDAQGEGEVEGVKAGQGEALHQQAFRRQQRQGEEQSGPVPSRAPAGRPQGQPAPQQQKDRGEEQAVACVVEEEEQGLVPGPEGLQGGGEAEIAVPQQPGGIEQKGGKPRPAGPKDAQKAVHQAGPQHQGGEVPQVVKGAVEEHISQQGEAALLQGVVVEVQGEVEQDRGPVKQQQLFDKGDQGGPPLPEQTGHQEPAGHREEKGDGDAGQNVGQKVVGLPVQGEQRAGMDGDDQQGGGDAEAVKATERLGFHPASLHRVSTTPPSLVSQRWQGTSAGRVRESAAQAGR